MKPLPRPAFDLDETFDQDYLDFYAPHVDAERSDHEASLIAELLQLQPKHKVLDLGCGDGRIAVRLAERGLAVSGLDRSELFLQHARARADAHGVDVLWLQADQRRLHFLDEYDAVVSWFTTFGYDDDATSRNLLTRIHRTLVPGGRFLLETLNLFQAAYDDDDQVLTCGEDRMVDVRAFDPLGGHVTHVRTVERAGRPTRRFRFSVRLFAPAELRDWLEHAGFVDIEAFDEDGNDFDIESTRLILTARKP
ncbi:MAG: cyclopropane-fatty-acyl-phospholipid synthase family protein [Planctomycetota bacterium]